MSQPMHFPKASVPIPDLDNNFVIRSASEEGYWSNEIGWCYDYGSATVFAKHEFEGHIPLTVGNDAEWVSLRQAIDYGNFAAD